MSVGRINRTLLITSLSKVGGNMEFMQGTKFSTQSYVKPNSTNPVTMTTKSSNILSQLFTSGLLLLYSDAIALCFITCIGLLGNSLTILLIISRKQLRKVTNMFILHHCLISLIQCILFIPFMIGIINESKVMNGCEIFSGIFVTTVTANVLNIAASAAAEAYRFEDLIQNKFSNTSELSTLNNSITELNRRGLTKDLNTTIINIKNSSVRKFEIWKFGKSSASCSCGIFGLVMIWLASVILHLGITLIGSSDNKQYSQHANATRNCFFTHGDRRSYILYIMWIWVDVISLIVIVKYVRKIYTDVYKYKKNDAHFFLKSSSIVLKNDNSNNMETNGIENKRACKHGLVEMCKLCKRKARSFSTIPTCELDSTRSPPCKRSTTVNGNLESISKVAKNKLTNIRSKSLSEISKSIKRKSFKTFKSNLTAQQQQKRKHKRNYDIMKQILQRIKLQFIIVTFFILCWLPLFITVAVDAKFKVVPKVYSYLLLIAFSNSSISPFFYLTILIPRINKFCFPCLRTDGKRSRRKSQLYDAMATYFDRVGNRFHNLSMYNSSSSIYSSNLKNELDNLNSSLILPLSQSQYHQFRQLNPPRSNTNAKLLDNSDSIELIRETSFISQCKEIKNSEF